jgi:PTH1 family peptidyl-tRNA hydrolase
LKFIVGIGNPEPKYDRTRHNIGFAVVDAINKKYAVRWNKEKDLFISKLSDDVSLIRPQLYVNNTGGAVSIIEDKFHPAKNDLLFVCDDVNLAFGKLRLRSSGSSGGHHGLQSVIEQLQSEDFPRLRIGIGNETMPKDDLTDFVLGHFTTEEKKALGGVLEKAASVCESWMNEGFGGATTCLSRLQSVK